jgi:GNAT superfamily N-acetyltransferase
MHCGILRAVLSRVRRLRRYVETNGARKTAAAIARAMRGVFFADDRLIVIVKELDSIVEPWSKGELRIEDLKESDMPALAELNRTRGRPDVQRLFERYVEQGFHGFVAYMGQEMVGYYWWVDGTVPVRYTDPGRLKLGMELGEADAYGSHFFMLEEHRGGGVAADFLYEVESSLRDRGFVRLWGFVTSNNRPARWLYSTRGYRPMWVVRLRRIMFFRRSTRESL